MMKYTLLMLGTLGALSAGALNPSTSGDLGGGVGKNLGTNAKAAGTTTTAPSTNNATGAAFVAGEKADTIVYDAAPGFHHLPL